MPLLAENLRYLRAGRKLSQQKLAAELIITRGRLAKYEEGASEPPLEILLRIARYFHISIDILLSVDLRKVPMEKLLKLADNRILLPITVDPDGNDHIEIIPHSAKAGYLNGYADPEFIESLQRISLPFLNNGKFRAFPVEGDSMPPHKEGSFIVGKYVESISDIRDGKTYILLTKNQGIVYKRVSWKNKNVLVVRSDNNLYQPFDIRLSEVLEIWQFACSIATSEAEPDDLGNESIKDMIRGLRRELLEIKNRR